jgi:hypothetical protein
MSEQEVLEKLQTVPKEEGQIIIGGYISSIYRESIDSVKVLIGQDGIWVDTVFSQDGFFASLSEQKGELIDLSVSHSDYHDLDTSFITEDGEINVIMLRMKPKYKILLRGRVYAGNIPLEGVDVKILYEDQEYTMATRGCFYDKENYWNCLFDGMFKQELTAENTSDSIRIFLRKDGLKPYDYGMIFKEYKGEIMQMKMKYESKLPFIPLNNINLKLGFPFLSAESDWFVSFSYYRLINNSSLKRLAWGIDGNMYITNVSVEHITFNGLEPAKADSSYPNAFLGPSVLFWFISPERRLFSSYAGTTLSFDVKSWNFVPQFYLGSRVLLDLNKAISAEIRYCEFSREVTYYTFNPYGNASKYEVSEKFMKLHATLGIQIVF